MVPSAGAPRDAERPSGRRRAASRTDVRRFHEGHGSGSRHAADVAVRRRQQRVPRHFLSLHARPPGTGGRGFLVAGLAAICRHAQSAAFDQPGLVERVLLSPLEPGRPARSEVSAAGPAGAIIAIRSISPATRTPAGICSRSRCRSPPPPGTSGASSGRTTSAGTWAAATRKATRAGSSSAPPRRPCARIPPARRTWTAVRGRTAGRRKTRCASASTCAPNCSPIFIPAPGKAARSRCRSTGRCTSSTPAAEEAYRNPQEYFFGDNLLVAPITSPGQGPDKIAQQTVWFPPGEWYDWFTGRHFSGERTETVSADINRFPLYARGGVPIPLQPYTQRMTTAALNQLVVRCYPGADGQSASTTLYEDDGVTTRYLKGRVVTDRVDVSALEEQGGRDPIAVEGQLCGAAREAILPGGTARDRQSRAMSRSATGNPRRDYLTDYDESTHTIHVRIAPRPIHDDVTVSVDF